MQVHDVFYNLEFTKLKVTAAWSVQAEDLKPSLMLGVTQLLEACLHNM